MPQLNQDMVIHGRYQLQRPLGRGGFSIVWLALDLKAQNRPVALKVSLPDKDPAGEQPIRMEHQHNTTRHLVHPHLLRSQDFFMIEDAGCLVFDYMAGGTLHQRVRTSGSLKESEITKVMTQIGSALQFLHEHSLVHFDVKPENILIDAIGNYSLSDFDTASRLENSMVRVSRIYADTPQYRSPEHLRGASELSEKVDIFAFGTTLFELCEGIMEKELGIGMMLLSGAPKPELTRGNYAGRLENLIHACWNHNPADRPTADALVSYGDFVAKNHFWPEIVEYKEHDKPIIDLPSGRGAETARVTIGRLTVVQNPEQPPVKAEKKPAPSEKVNKEAKNNMQEETTKFRPNDGSGTPAQGVPEKKSTNQTKMGLIVLLSLLLLGAGGYLIWQMMITRKFDGYMQEAIARTAENKLKAAFDAVTLASEVKPEDSTAIKQRRTIIRKAFEQHTSDLMQVREVLATGDDFYYADICSLLQEHQENASLLKADDSTAHFLSLIPGCMGANEPVSPDQTTTPGGETPKQETLPVKESDKQGKPDPVVITDPTIKKEVIKQPDPTPPQPDPDAIVRQQMKAELNDWVTTKRNGTIPAYQDFLKKWPAGQYYMDAQKAIKDKEQEQAAAKSKIVETTTVVEDNKRLSNSKSAGMPLSQRVAGCKKPSEGGVLIIKPTVVMELTEFTIFGDAPGKVQIILQDATGKKLGSVTRVVSNGLTQCNLSDLDYRLKANVTYKLSVTPLRNDKGAAPMLENMRDCSPTFSQDSNLGIDYQQNFVVFNLKYVF